jgi:hypothetical protein
MGKRSRKQASKEEVSQQRPFAVGEVLVEVGAELRELMVKGGLAIAAAKDAERKRSAPFRLEAPDGLQALPLIQHQVGAELIRDAFSHRLAGPVLHARSAAGERDLFRARLAGGIITCGCALSSRWWCWLWR